MDYVIKNNNNVFIKLNENGQPVTCVENVRGIFEYSKAKNIAANLPKTLKRMHFTVKAVPEITQQKQETRQETIITEDYEIPESVSRWLDKFGICEDIISEARTERDELESKLSNIDKEISNILHSIELEKSKNAYQGYLEYKKMKSVLERRRNIKDEKMILEHILKMNFSSFDADQIDKAIKGLANRKFKLRMVEVNDLQNA